MSAQDGDGNASYEFIIDGTLAGKRVDKALSTLCADHSRSRLQSLISDGQVVLNGKVLSSASLKVEEGDALRVTVPDPKPAKQEPENIPLDVVYEDDDLLVINKPAGLVVHPGAGNWSGTLVNALLYHCGDNLSGIGGELRPGIVHRLDKDTSGLMMVAKNDHAHKYLSAQLADRSLSRKYLAIVLGVPMPIKGTIDLPIGRDRHNRLKMSVRGNAMREAQTHFHVLENYADAFALVSCKLQTGRTHQIRVHMQALGHHLIGDPLYGPQKTAVQAKLKKTDASEDLSHDLLNFGRPALHAAEIEFIHPRTEKTMYFEMEAPDDFSKILKLLSKL